MTVHRVGRLLLELESSGALNGSPNEWGPRVWKILEGTMDMIPCGNCRMEGRLMLDGLHDMVNVAKGEEPERPKALCELADQVQRFAKVSRSCDIRGRPRAR